SRPRARRWHGRSWGTRRPWPCSRRRQRTWARSRSLGPDWRVFSSKPSCYTRHMAEVFSPDSDEESRAERARERRRSWAGGKVTQEQHENLEQEFWSRATSDQRLAAVWQLAQQVWTHEHPGEPPLRLDRSAWGIRKYRSAE